MYRITEKCKRFIKNYDDTRVKILCNGGYKGEHKVVHDCRGNKHIERYIYLHNLMVEVDNKRAFIKKKIKFYYGASSRFNDIEIGDSVEFYARIWVDDGYIGIIYPSKLKINN